MQYISFPTSLLVIMTSILTGWMQHGTAQSRYTLSPDLEITQVSDFAYVHTSYSENETYGRFSSNGVIYADSGQAIVFDTPVSPEQSKILLDWLQDSMKFEVLGVVVNHFHTDCLGGLEEFHKRKIKSIAHRKTQKLAKQAGNPVPEIGFVRSLDLQVGAQFIVCKHLGEAHTKDNLVTWFPGDNMIFGGCMVKSLKSGKGNTADANLDEWANTIKLIKETFPGLKIVVPGHGKTGDATLLDYTIEMFETNP